MNLIKLFFLIAPRRRRAHGYARETGEGRQRGANADVLVRIIGLEREANHHQSSACSFGWWLVLVCSERKVLFAGC
jgi:hypothetical protein